MRVVGDQLNMLLAELHRHAREEWLVVVAFDGALTRYHVNPAAVRLKSRQQTLLRRIADVPGVTLAIISGRRLADLHARANIGNDVFYIGLHGLEVIGPDFVRVHSEIIDESREVLRALEHRLAPSIISMHGVHLENKEAALALHTRGADSGDAIWSRLLFLSHAAGFADAGLVRVVRGHDVLEALPNRLHLRATAICAVREVVEQRGLQRPFVLYMGADMIDDDGFDAVGDTGVGVVVGRRAIDAHYQLTSRADVDRVMTRLAMTWRAARRYAWKPA